MMVHCMLWTPCSKQTGWHTAGERTLITTVRDLWLDLDLQKKKKTCEHLRLYLLHTAGYIFSSVIIPLVNDTTVNINLIALQGICLLNWDGSRTGWRTNIQFIWKDENGVGKNRNAMLQLHNRRFTARDSVYHHSMCDSGTNEKPLKGCEICHKLKHISDAVAKWCFFSN